MSGMLTGTCEIMNKVAKLWGLSCHRVVTAWKRGVGGGGWGRVGSKGAGLFCVSIHTVLSSFVIFYD